MKTNDKITCKYYEKDRCEELGCRNCDWGIAKGYNFLDAIRKGDTNEICSLNIAPDKQYTDRIPETDNMRNMTKEELAREKEYELKHGEVIELSGQDKVIASGKLRIERDTQKRFVQAYIVTNGRYISAGELIEEEQAEKYDKQEVTISISKECDDDRPRCSTK